MFISARPPSNVFNAYVLVRKSYGTFFKQPYNAQCKSFTYTLIKGLTIMKELNEYEVNTVSGGLFDLFIPLTCLNIATLLTIDTAGKVISIAATTTAWSTALAVGSGMAAASGGLGGAVVCGVGVAGAAAGTLMAAQGAINIGRPLQGMLR